MTLMEGVPNRAPEDPQVGELSIRRDVLQDSMLCTEVDAVFRSDPDLRSIVVRTDIGIHLVSRAVFHESLAGPNGFGYSLFGNKPLSALPITESLTVTAETPCEWVTQQVLAAGHSVDDEVLVKFTDGGYGTASVAELLDHLWNLSRGRARRIDSDRRRLHALIDHASDLTLVVDQHGILKWANVSDRSHFPFTNLLDGVETTEISTAWDLLARSIQNENEVVSGEFRFRFGTDEYRWFSATFRALTSDPAVRGIVVTMRDIEVERQLRDGLIQGASADPLTGLANRSAVTAHFDNAVASGQCPTLLILDLDDFKVINDRFGQATGDAVLQDVSQRLRSVAGLHDTVARFGGDSFALITAIGADDQALGERVHAALSKPFTISDVSLRLSASVGVATMDDQSIDAATLTDHATLALREAKTRGKNHTVAFNQTLVTAALERDAMRDRLRVALATDAFSLVFQPQMSLASDQPLRGFEALIRWADPASGTVPPDQFIPLAEDTGEIVEIGRWVISGALEQLAEWHRYGAKLTMAVNTSVRELAEADFASFVRRELERRRIEPQSLEIEISETALATDDVAVLDSLNQLRDLGVGIAVDNYGSGHASIAYLRRFPISTIKVDRTLVSQLDDEPRTASVLLKSITDVARALGMRSVVEGLETADQTAQARELGFDLGQGWHCGMPMSALRASKLVAVARRDDSAPQLDEQAPDLDSFEATLDAFDAINADALRKADRLAPTPTRPTELPAAPFVPVEPTANKRIADMQNMAKALAQAIKADVS